eukprot:scaffold38333_cov40-Tisochrysis_lutea.AAC.1
MAIHCALPLAGLPHLNLQSSNLYVASIAELISSSCICLATSSAVWPLAFRAAGSAPALKSNCTICGLSIFHTAMCRGSEPRSARVETDAPSSKRELASEVRPVSAAHPSEEQRYGPPSVSTPALPDRISASASSSRSSSRACHKPGSGSVVSAKSAPARVMTPMSDVAPAVPSTAAPDKAQCAAATWRSAPLALLRAEACPGRVREHHAAHSDLHYQGRDPAPSKFQAVDTGCLDQMDLAPGGAWASNLARGAAWEASPA